MGPLDFVTIDILGPLLHNTNEIAHLIVFTNWYVKLGRAAPTAKKTAKHVPNDFFDHWTLLGGVPTKILTDNDL